MTEFSDKIDDILNKFGVIGVPQHVAKGIQRHRDTDYDVLHLALHDEAKHLNSDYLTELIYQAKFLRARQGDQEMPERPAPTVAGHGPPLGPDGHPESFQNLCNKSKNPIPLDSAFPENQHSTYADDEPIGEEKK